MGQLAEKYLARARAQSGTNIPDHQSPGSGLLQRSDFLGSRLALLDKIIQASIASKQHSNAVGALKLQAQLETAESSDGESNRWFAG